MSDNADHLADQLATGLAQAGTARATPGLYRPLLRLLAGGEPVTTAALADAAGRPEPQVAQALTAWPDTEYDDAGRIIGYGITQRPTPHRFIVAGRQLYTWCALDTLIFPAILDQPAHVESPCHATSTPVRLTVHPTDGVTDLDPATAVVSIVTVEHNCDSVRTAFCDQVHFFTDAAAATGWLDQHPGMHVLPVADAYQLGAPLIDTLLDTSDASACCST